ncbi:MAG TPA: nickel pincer cofactor biosynthesis protein LarB [Anaerolineaceae bacterium]|nr:nickel pincer cofactor biosynthesis protein LarB [Anaerolineaceae bacterium]HPN51685.1 nickel pincer cofactor biosynthesis protein LarB [Anaerolineaceae bacterium]
MDTEKLSLLLEQVQDGRLSVTDALDSLKNFPYESLGGFATIDHHRHVRTGFPEVIFSQGKTPEQVVQIFHRLQSHNKQVMATRLSAEAYHEIKSQLPEAIYLPDARVLYSGMIPEQDRAPGILVLTAGTSDIPVAEEAAITAELMGNRVKRIYDVGVAGLHRLLDRLSILQEARVIIVVAGMEGALPSVVGGLVSAPVIAVPTSIGYGASFQGLSALLAMLNSCANGIGVVNIDNGYGAGCLAAKINRNFSPSPTA